MWLKVSKTQKQIVKSWILPKNEQMNSILLLWYLRSTCFRSFFGRNWRHQKDISKLTDLYYGNSSRNVFVRFLGELKKPKRHLEINWPLTQPTLKTIRRSYQDNFLCWVVEFLPGVYKRGHLYKSYFVILVVWLFVCICNLLIYIWTTSNNWVYFKIITDTL